MRFNIAGLVLASGLTSAAGIAPVVNNTHTQPSSTILIQIMYIVRQENLDIVRQLPEACSVAACLNLTAQLTCIANAIANNDPVALQKCFTTYKSQVTIFFFVHRLCSCVACFPSIENILITLGICPASKNDIDKPSSM
ncbi:hypothetical protein N7516_009186 [Penicillium verrucosum]|uniref:uncharacterized protein n=1 Tax=Penicillium verrucosum TaxID=60171 RepID=UPI0025450CDD|nr:uncharacterized protein N7516_009186 [Penicillium verrucosum]KAJ5927413.1 hypothetical protein N7516_009186 [Penicillium verrucosum]